MKIVIPISALLLLNSCGGGGHIDMTVATDNYDGFDIVISFCVGWLACVVASAISNALKK